MSHFNTPLQRHLSLYLMPPTTSPYSLKCFVSFSSKGSTVSCLSIFLAAHPNLLISPSFGARGPAPAPVLLPKPLEGSYTTPSPRSSPTRVITGWSEFPNTHFSSSLLLLIQANIIFLWIWPHFPLVSLLPAYPLPSDLHVIDKEMSLPCKGDGSEPFHSFPCPPDKAQFSPMAHLALNGFTSISLSLLPVKVPRALCFPLSLPQHQVLASRPPHQFATSLMFEDAYLPPHPKGLHAHLPFRSLQGGFSKFLPPGQSSWCVLPWRLEVLPQSAGHFLL